MRVIIGKRRFGERHMWFNATTTTISVQHLSYSHHLDNTSSSQHQGISNSDLTPFLLFPSTPFLSSIESPRLSFKCLLSLSTQAPQPPLRPPRDNIGDQENWHKNLLQQGRRAPLAVYCCQTLWPQHQARILKRNPLLLKTPMLPQPLARTENDGLES